MNKYTQYAPDGITDCDPALSDSSVASDLSNQPCRLALARGKSSLIRVGGGENFGKILLCSLSHLFKSPLTTYTQNLLNYSYAYALDKAYRAVITANKAMEGGYKYHLVGGASGTVSPSKSSLQMLLDFRTLTYSK